MYIFCSKALADALNIKKNELQKMLADAQMDDLYAWHVEPVLLHAMREL